MEQDNLFSPINPSSEPTDHVVSSDASMPNWIIQDSPIFDPEFYDSLIQIINQLDPSSFVKLARTCRTFHHFCFSTKGIQVRFGSSMELEIFFATDDSMPEGVRLALSKTRYRHEQVYVFSEELIEKILKMPFCVVVMCVVINLGREREADTLHLESLLRYLRRFCRLDLRKVFLQSWNSDWNTLAEIVQEFGVSDVDISWHEGVAPIPENVLHFFATNLTTLDYPYYVSDELLLATTVKYASFYEASISVYIFKKLLEKFIAGEFCYWFIGCQPLMGNNDDSDPFVDACSEVMKVAQVENVNSIIKDPGVLYWSPNDPWKFHLLRADGTKGGILFAVNIILFS